MLLDVKIRKLINTKNNFSINIILSGLNSSLPMTSHKEINKENNIHIPFGSHRSIDSRRRTGVIISHKSSKRISDVSPRYATNYFP